MVDPAIKTAGLISGLFAIVTRKSTKTVSDIASENVIEPTIDLVEATASLAENAAENIEVFFHKEKTFGLVFLLIVIVIILSYKLKNG